VSWLRFPRNLGIACCLYFLAMTALFGNMTVENSEFSATAREVPGTVIALVAKPLPGGTRVPNGTRHREPMAPTVRYVVDGHSYTYTPARGKRHPTVQVGDTVTVLYDATDPATTARIRGEGAVALPLVTAGFLATAVGLAVLLVLTRPRRRPNVDARRPGPPGAGSGPDPPGPHPTGAHPAGAAAAPRPGPSPTAAGTHTYG
jgi:hypothetical protein